MKEKGLQEERPSFKRPSVKNGLTQPTARANSQEAKTTVAKTTFEEEDKQYEQSGRLDKMDQKRKQRSSSLRP